MEHFKTNIALIPKFTGLEKTLALLIVAVMFIPFAVGVMTENPWLLASLPIGFLLLFIFNRISKGKLDPKNWVQDNSFVDFTLSGIKVSSNTTERNFLWSELERAQLNIEGFDGESKSSDPDDGRYNGTENRLMIHARNVRLEFNFYLKNAEQKEALKLFLQKEQLNTSNVHLTFKAQRSTYSADLDGFKAPPKKQDVQPKSRKGLGCIILFATPFVLMGLVTLVFPIYQFGKVIQAKDWMPIKAKVLSVDMLSSTGSSTQTYKVGIQYQYTVGSESYIGNAVSFNAGMDNIEHYRDLYDKLDRSRIIRIYVNKRDPNEAVIIRGVTNAMVAVIIISIMWNALILTFALPMWSRKIKMKNVLVITVIIWVLGVCKFVFPIGDIDISQQVSVIEVKEEIEK